MTSRAHNKQRRYEAAVRRQIVMHTERPREYAPVSEVLRSDDSAPQCTCTPGPDGHPDTDGCPLHDLIVCGLLIGEEGQ